MIVVTGNATSTATALNLTDIVPSIIERRYSMLNLNIVFSIILLLFGCECVCVHNVSCIFPLQAFNDDANDNYNHLGLVMYYLRIRFQIEK